MGGPLQKATCSVLPWSCLRWGGVWHRGGLPRGSVTAHAGRQLSWLRKSRASPPSLSPLGPLSLALPAALDMAVTVGRGRGVATVPGKACCLHALALPCPRCTRAKHTASKGVPKRRRVAPAAHPFFPPAQVVFKIMSQQRPDVPPVEELPGQDRDRMAAGVEPYCQLMRCVGVVWQCYAVTLLRHAWAGRDGGLLAGLEPYCRPGGCCCGWPPALGSAACCMRGCLPLPSVQICCM